MLYCYLYDCCCNKVVILILLIDFISLKIYCRMLVLSVNKISEF